MSIAREQPTKKTFDIRQLILPISAILVVAYFLAPIIWQVLTSFKVNADISAIPNVYIPKRITFEHYLSLFQRRPFALYILNSAFVSITSTLLCLAVGAPAAYALARLRLWARKSSWQL
jgi:multiple sugar transport system permease protein